jgi:hypothetical protein
MMDNRRKVFFRIIYSSASLLVAVALPSYMLIKVANHWKGGRRMKEGEGKGERRMKEGEGKGGEGREEGGGWVIWQFIDTVITTGRVHKCNIERRKKEDKIYPSEWALFRHCHADIACNEVLSTKCSINRTCMHVWNIHMSLCVCVFVGGGGGGGGGGFGGICDHCVSPTYIQ